MPLEVSLIDAAGNVIDQVTRNAQGICRIE
jgi:hypothetical protein